MNRRRAAFWIAQGALLVAVAALLWRAVGRHWDQLRTTEVVVEVRPAWLLPATLAVLASYTLLIEAWRRLIQGWGERLPYRDAVRIWTIANLGRYIPGKVWAVAGLAVLARRTGVAGWAAAGSAVVMQGIALGTGAAIVVGFLPGTLHGAWLAAAVALAVVTVVVPTWPVAVRRLGSLAGQPDLAPLSWRAVTASALAATASWIAYGIAFWCLVRGVVPGVALDLPLAIGAFAAGYIVGLLAVFAPGGIGVREVTLGALIGGVLGVAGAGVAAAAQRILFTLTEGLAALVGLALGGLGPGDGDD